VDNVLGIKIRADTSQFDSKIKSVQSSVLALTKKFALAGVAAAAAFAGMSIKNASDFESHLAEVSTMLDKANMKYMPEYKKGLEEMSTAFGEGTDTLSKGLYNILSASVAPSKALNVLSTSAKAAAAGISDTGTAADAITTILNSYKMSADKARSISDLLFEIVKRGKTTFSELAPSIGRVASTASMAHVSLNELGAMVATLTRNGISTDEAMTSINGVLRAFLKPADDAKKVAREFGFELNTNTLKSIGLIGVLEKLKGATAEQVAQIFPDIRGLKGVAAALGNLKGVTSDYNAMLNSAGATQEAYNKIANTTSFRLKQLKQDFNVLKDVIGQNLLPMFTPLLIGTQGLIQSLITINEKSNMFGDVSTATGNKVIESFEKIAIAMAIVDGKFRKIKAFMEEPITIKMHIASESLSKWLDKTSDSLSKSLDKGAAAIGKKIRDIKEWFFTPENQIAKQIWPERETFIGPIPKEGVSSLSEYKKKTKEIDDATKKEIADIKSLFQGLNSTYDAQKKTGEEAGKASNKNLNDYLNALKGVGSAADSTDSSLKNLQNTMQGFNTLSIQGISGNRLLNYIGNLRPTKTTIEHSVVVSLKWDGQTIRINPDSLNNPELIEKIGRSVMQQILSGRGLAFGGG